MATSKNSSGNKTGSSKRNAVVELLIDLLNGGHAHVDYDTAVKNIPEKFRGQKPAGLPYSIWQLIEHIRIAQWDILEFSRNEHHKSPVWPDGYWPGNPAPKEGEWEKSIARIKNDRQAFIGLLKDQQNDLYVPFPYGDGQTLFQEALLLTDHNSYHTGEIIAVRRILGIW